MLARSPANPILTRADVPPIPPRLVDPTSVFNPGAVHFRGRHRLLLRVQARSRETFLVPAESEDGVRFTVARRFVELPGLERAGRPIYHVYDPRLTCAGDDCYVLFAADTDGACLTGVARTRDFERFELLGIDAGQDTRNAVLFPEKVGGRFLRLERPNRPQAPGEPPSGDEIILAESEDLVRWTVVGPVLCGRPHYWDERIGSGPPPVKTRAGWLHLYHGVATHFQSVSIYQAGAVLLDLEDPARVLARTWNNILEPRESYELVGQVPNVVFPSGMIVDAFDAGGFALPEARVLVYYGAADTCVGLATSTVERLIAACREGA
ncbi:MAG: glycoside hydrolase family 130 protein [Planctomycetes bacterium]|nr:glycoside hydrolase family 130 protein [Planctomycetota bacterium]